MKDSYEPFHDEDLAYWPPDRINEKKSIEDVPAAPEVHHELESKDRPEVEPNRQAKKPEYIDEVQRRKLPDRIVFGDQLEPLYPELINDLIVAQEIEARIIKALIIKALTSIGLTVATSTNAIESMRQAGITFTILSP